MGLHVTIESRRWRGSRARMPLREPISFAFQNDGEIAFGIGEHVHLREPGRPVKPDDGADQQIMRRSQSPMPERAIGRPSPFECDLPKCQPD